MRSIKAKEVSKKRGLKFYVGIIICVFFIPILIVNISIIVNGIVAPDDVPNIFGTVPMVVLTDSMNTDREEIAAGDMIFTQKVDVGTVNEEDIILFKQGRSLVLHRIMEIDITDEGKQFITKGDANNTEDTKPVMEDEVIGIYRSRVPRIGHFILFMKTVPGMLLCIGVPLLIFVGYEFFQKNKESKQKEKEILELRKMLINSEKIETRRKEDEDKCKREKVNESC